VAFGAQVVGAVDLCPTHHGEDRAGTHTFIFGDMTTGTRNGSVVGVRRLKSQEFGESGGASLMDRGANRYLHGLQIQLAGPMPVGEDALELQL